MVSGGNLNEARKMHRKQTLGTELSYLQTLQTLPLLGRLIYHTRGRQSGPCNAVLMSTAMFVRQHGSVVLELGFRR